MSIIVDKDEVFLVCRLYVYIIDVLDSLEDSCNDVINFGVFCESEVFEVDFYIVFYMFRMVFWGSVCISGEG